MARRERIDIQDILTPGQIAKFCRVDPRTVNRWIEQKILKSHALPITQFNRVCVRDFLDFLKVQKMPVPEVLQGLNKHRVLIVDDEESVVNTIREIIRRLGPDDFELQSAADGFEAGRMVESFKPDIVVLDLMLPRVNGFEVCRQIKSDPKTRHIKVLIVSGHLNKGDQEKLASLGADSFLDKPFTNSVLKENVMELLDR